MQQERPPTRGEAGGGQGYLTTAQVELDRVKELTRGKLERRGVVPDQADELARYRAILQRNTDLIRRASAQGKPFAQSAVNQIEVANALEATRAAIGRILAEGDGNGDEPR
jgi:hypothetical protein